MKFNSLEFVQQYGIDYTTEHHHCTGRFLNVHCPFCPGKQNYHLGLHLAEGFCNCWRCGHHSIGAVIKQLVGCSWEEVYRIRDRYSDVGRVIETIKKVSTSPFTLLPYGVAALQETHKNYLIQRQFNPVELAKKWELSGTGHLGEYKFRIIAPIYVQNRLVSYQGRDITNRSSLKYMACRGEDEVIHHKHTLYGIDKIRGNRVVVVEGITDVWRLGDGAVATFGIKWTKQQMLLLAKYKDVLILYDLQEQAREQASKLADELAMVTNVTLLNLETVSDPAAMPQRDADKLMKSLGFL